MQTIWKYPLYITDIQSVLVPRGAKPLSVAMVRGKVCVYCLVNIYEEELESLPVAVYGTGHEHHNISGTFLGTVVDEPFVWHVFIP
jgi:hypothetical protein